MRTGKAPYVPKDTLRRTLDAQHGVHALRNRTILLLSHYLGLRAKELAGLTVGDVFDLATGQVKEVVRLTKTKGDRFREAFLVNDEARDHVRRHIISRPARSTAPLFLSQKGGAFTANTMQKLLHNIYAEAGVSASSHSGRRSFATRLIEGGADVYAVMQMMGHSSIMTTQQYFATSPERLKRFAGVL
jgi:integrase/recombinase XerD